MKTIKKYLFFLDFFRSPITFYFDSQTYISSSFGIVVSIPIYLLLVYTFFHSNMILKKDPFISSINEGSTDKIIMDPTNLAPVMLFFDSKQQKFFQDLDETYIKISITQNIYFAEQNLSINLQLKKCSISDYKPDLMLESFASNALCFNQSLKLSNGNVLGISSDNVYISFSKCKNEGNFTCGSNEEIDNYLSSIQILFGYVKSSFQANNYEQPFKQSYEFYTLQFNTDNEIYYGLGINSIDFQQDDNIFYEETTHRRFYDDSPLFPFYKKAKNSENLGFFRILMGNNKKTIVRKYEKLSTALAKIGGMASIFHFLGQFFANFLLHYFYLKQNHE